MDIKQLTSFIAVAECGSFSRAEESEYISKQALLKQINNLEEEIGVKLLKRSTIGIELTNEGRIFLEGASRIVGDIDGLIQECRKPAAVRESLRLSNVEHQKLLTPVLNAFVRKYPEIKLEYIIHPNHSGEFRVREGLMDIAETFLDPSSEAAVELVNNTPGVRYSRLCDLPYAAVMGKADPLAGNTRLSFAQLTGRNTSYFRFITRPEVAEALNKVFEHDPELLTCRMDIDNQVQAAFECTESGSVLITCNPYIYYMKELTVIPLECSAMQEYGILTAESPTPAAQHFADMARFLFRKHGSDLVINHEKYL